MSDVYYLHDSYVISVADMVRRLRCLYCVAVPFTSSRRAFTAGGYITQVQFYHKTALSSTQLLSRLCGLDVALPDGSDANIGKLLYCTFLAVYSIQH